DRASYKHLAQTWAALSQPDSRPYAARLLGALRESGLSAGAASRSRFQRVSSRLNHEVGANLWVLSQLVVDPRSPDAAAHHQFAPAVLEGQIGGSGLQDSRAYFEAWKQTPGETASGAWEFPVPSEIQEAPSVSYTTSANGLGAPRGKCQA